MVPTHNVKNHIRCDDRVNMKLENFLELQTYKQN